MRFDGETCMMCHRVFTEEDEVVVCPTCGTPYHRACYKQVGKCINDELHTSGGVWKGVQTVLHGTKCPRCGRMCGQNDNNCPSCGTALHGKPSEKITDFESSLQQQLENSGIPAEFIAPELTDEKQRLADHTVQEYCDFVNSNALYHVPRFVDIAERGKRLFINLPAMFFPQYYYAYRKMVPAALLLAALLTILDIPRLMQNFYSLLPEYISMFQNVDETLKSSYAPIVEALQNAQTRLSSYENLLYNTSLICYTLRICLSLVFGMLANLFYFRHATKEIAKAKQSGLVKQVYRRYLHERGGTSLLYLLMVFGIQLALYSFIVLTMFMLV